jgi:hypothetical protein
MPAAASPVPRISRDAEVTVSEVLGNVAVERIECALARFETVNASEPLEPAEDEATVATEVSEEVAFTPPHLEAEASAEEAVASVATRDDTPSRALSCRRTRSWRDFIRAIGWRSTWTS